MGGRHHAEAGRHHHAGTEAGTVQARDAGGRAAIDGACFGALGRAQRFHGKHGVNIEFVFHATGKPIFRAQHFAYALEQRFLLRFRQIAHGDQGRVRLPARAADGQHGNVARAAIRDHGRFRLGIVDGVDQVVEIAPAQQLLQVIRGNKILDLRDLAKRVDQFDALGQGCYLGLADGVAHGLDLAIDVRFGNIIEVDQGQAADGAARQRFDDPGTDAAHADHTDVRGAEACQRGGAVQAGNAAETPFKIDLGQVHGN